MNPARQHNASFLFTVNSGIRNSQQRYLQASQRLSEHFLFEIVVNGVTVFHKLPVHHSQVLYHLCAVRVGERRGVCEMHLLPVCVKLVGEGQAVETHLFFSVVLLQKRIVVQYFALELYILPTLNPPALVYLADVTRKYVRLHPPAVHCLALLKIYQVQLYPLLTTVLHSEVKPLRMPPRIRIRPHEQVVLILVYLNAGVQIPALKQTVEDQFLVFGNGRIHPLEDAGGFGLEVGVELPEVGCHVHVVAIDDT